MEGGAVLVRAVVLSGGIILVRAAVLSGAVILKGAAVLPGGIGLSCRIGRLTDRIFVRSSGSRLLLLASYIISAVFAGHSVIYHF